MKLDFSTTNSAIEHCINEYVRLEEHRAILRDRFFRGMTFDELAGKYERSVSYIKDVIYGEGDDILLKAGEISDTIAAMQKTTK